ncbi:hypothetical protein [Sphingomonas alpina]|uniref:Uncharacterized protein n=1 Tax=Sphingomonas alpina TaxID=653931 RepID=A0A7H0LF70_9SPHN|nr:hypothetical protein [Sphingomonas alpina]QNQ08323.1 hypothetical protein H3Z74_16405 [Sphingomonas alpina]
MRRIVLGIVGRKSPDIRGGSQPATNGVQRRIPPAAAPPRVNPNALGNASGANTTTVLGG